MSSYWTASISSGTKFFLGFKLLGHVSFNLIKPALAGERICLSPAKAGLKYLSGHYPGRRSAPLRCACPGLHSDASFAGSLKRCKAYNYRPRFIYLLVGNYTVKRTEELLRSYSAAIHTFNLDDSKSHLMLP